MHFERVEHLLAGDNDLLGLLFDGKGADQGGYFFGRLPFGQLAETLLASPDRCVDDLHEELAGTRIEDKGGAVDRLGGQVALKGLVDGDAVDVGVVDKPDDLIAKQLAVVLARQVGLGGLRRVQLEPFSDAFAQDVQRRVGLDDLCHGLLDKRLQSGEPVAVR